VQSENPYLHNPYQQQNPSPSQPQPPPAPGRLPRRSRRWLWILAALVVVLLLACVGAIAAFVLAVNNSPARAAAQHYYDAIKGRDYSTAYSYLDPAMTLTVQNQSQQLTRQSFTMVAQAYDTQKGRVSDYSISGVTLNSSTEKGNTADIIVKVTRNTSYDVHLQVKQEGNDWKIVSFDSL
jgi:membrane protein implicated in regulation of membrane protease activity